MLTPHSFKNIYPSEILTFAWILLSLSLYFIVCLVNSAEGVLGWMDKLEGRKQKMKSDGGVSDVTSAQQGFTEQLKKRQNNQNEIQ